jgi:serine/threonine protein kinase
MDGHIRITDFGLSKVDIPDGELTKTVCGTFEYMAPEIFLKSGHDFRVDWYSLVTQSIHLQGTLLYLMLTGAPPFYSKNKHQMFQNRLYQPVRIKQSFSESVTSLLRGLLQVRPEKRLGNNGSTEIKNHPFFEDIDWKQLIRLQVKPP